MIDISQLTSLISAFRVETEKESISPEPSARQSLRLRVGEAGASYHANLCQTVGKLLQDILGLLAAANGFRESISPQ